MDQPPSKSASSDPRADFPDKLQCLFEPARYKILHGGRGAAKSWGIARALLILGAERKLRIACGREIQRSISDSVHQLLRNQIDALGFGTVYRVRENYIEGTNGTLITFHGLGKNIASVKSIEGIDIFWAEEAQNISKASWDILIPTIRNDGSEIWVSFNPELETDETYRRFVLDPPAGATVVRINWRDNPWFNDVLRGEMEDCRRRSEDDFLHIWEGNTGKVEERLYSDAECDALFRDDLAAHADGVLRCVPDLADRPEMLAAATSLAFNIGTSRFCRSTAARRFNAGDLAGGCRAIGAFTLAGGRRLNGLVRRRAAEVALCLEGVE